jgi:hypothetical protein
MIRTSCGQNRAMFSDWRPQNQERRASARRGSANRVRKCNAMNFGASSSHVERAETDEFARAVHATGGLRPPLLCWCTNVCGRKTIFLRCTYARPNQERRASARRGWVIRTLCRKKRALPGNHAHSNNSAMRQLAGSVVGRRLSATCWKRTCRRVCESTGGLRPPLLVHSDRSPEK